MRGCCCRRSSNGAWSGLSRIEGAFGFSVWDREARELWLARDRVGERPLYHGWYQGQFLFASELKALQAFAGFAPGIDQDALSLLLRHDYVRHHTPSTAVSTSWWPARCCASI